MKNLSASLAFVVGVALLPSCAEKKKTNDIIAPKPVVKAPAAPVKMQPFNHTESVEWGGQKYTVSIRRSVDESSPVFTDETGGKYYDNIISLVVKSPHGEEIFNRAFSKDSFSQFVDASYTEKSTLLGVAVDRVAGDRLVLVASVGCPDQLSDDFVPVTLSLAKSGEMTMKKGQDIGTSNNPNADEDEGV